MDSSGGKGEPKTAYLKRRHGRLAYDLAGDGPLLIAAPGMGDLRSVYRFLRPILVEGGRRVATLDLRGHGESDSSFVEYDDVAVGSDLLALVQHLGGPATLIGNSISAGAAAWAAAEAPQLVRSLVLIGPFVRDVPIGRGARLALRLGLLRPWGPRVWSAYYARLYPGRRPADLAEHRARIRGSLRRPGNWRSFIEMTHASHAPVEARLGDIRVPSLVVMGERDPDFPDPAAEAQLIAGRLGARVLMVPSAGHYPQAEYPEIVGPAVLDFLAGLSYRS